MVVGVLLVGVVVVVGDMEVIVVLSQNRKVESESDEKRDWQGFQKMLMFDVRRLGQK